MPVNSFPTLDVVAIRESLSARTFVDDLGVTHEVVHVQHAIGDVSLCGKLREPCPLGGKVPSQVRGHASSRSPRDVDCMTCLVSRVRLDAMVAADPRQPRGYPIQLDIRIVPWS